MTDLKFNILKLLYYTQPLRELKRGEIIDSIANNPILIVNALNELQLKNHIERSAYSDVYKLTESGADTFEQEQETRKQASKQKVQYTVSIILTLLTLLSTIFLSEPFIKLITRLTADKG